MLMFFYAITMIGSLFDSDDSPSSTSIPSELPPLNQIYYARRAVNVREGPGTQFPIAYTLGAGYRTYPGQPNGDGWAAVFSGPRTTSDTVGWVFKELLIIGNPPDLLLSSWDWESGGQYGLDYIVGEVVNTTLDDFSYAQITCKLYDAQGRHVGSALDNTNNLGDGETWRFSALVGEEGVSRYVCDSPTGW